MKKNSLKKNLVYQLLYQGLVFIYPLLTTPLVSRAFGSEVLGVYSYTYAIAYYFSLIALLGLGNYGNRMIAMCRDEPLRLRRMFWELYSIQIICSVATLLVYVLFVAFFEKRFLVVALLQGLMIVANMFDISWFLSGLEEFRSMVLRNSFVKISSLLLIFGLIKEKSDLNIYIIIMTVTLIVGQLSMWPTVIKIIGKPCFLRQGMRKHFFQVVKLFIPIIATNAYTVIDKTFLGVFRTMQEVGYYENSDKLVRMPIGLVSAACAVLLPRAAYFISHGEKEKSDRYVENTLSITLMLIIPITIGLATITSEIVPWYFGEDFLPCIEIIRWLSAIIFFITISTILRIQYCIPNQLDKEYMVSTIIGAISNLLLNIFLIRPYGIYGVIIGSVVAEAISAMYLLIKLREKLNFKPIFKLCVGCVLACIPMVILIREVGAYFGASFGTNILQMVVGGAVYGVIMAGFYFYVKYVKTKEECS